MTLILFLAASIAGGSPEPAAGWAEFSKSPALRRVSERVQIGTLGSVRGQLHYWLRRTVTEADRKTVTWTDSRTCAAVRPMLSSMQDLSTPRPAPYGFDDGGEITLDGVGYMLRTPARYGSGAADLTLRSNVNTPLARWVEQSLAALAPCWKIRAPERTIR